MVLVCGVDVGSLSTPSYVAWLQEGQFVLDLYVPSVETPLPRPPRGQSLPRCIALDAPQGLPRPGRARRAADELANTPTRTLPNDRRDLERRRLYAGLVRAGVALFWSAHRRGAAAVVGLATPDHRPALCETYPRYIARRLWPDLTPPSKRRDPLAYVETLWGRLQGLGYACPSVARPCVDHVDAMLCAVAAEAYAAAGGLPAGSVGEPPFVDEAEHVIREGYIVSP